MYWFVIDVCIPEAEIQNRNFPWWLVCPGLPTNPGPSDVAATCTQVYLRQNIKVSALIRHGSAFLLPIRRTWNAVRKLMFLAFWTRTSLTATFSMDLVGWSLSVLSIPHNIFFQLLMTSSPFPLQCPIVPSLIVILLSIIPSEPDFTFLTKTGWLKKTIDG